MASSFSPISQSLVFTYCDMLKSFIIHPRSRQSTFYHHTSILVVLHDFKFCFPTLRHTQPVLHHPPVFQALIKLNVFLVPLTSIYLPLITIWFHCCDIMSTASSSIPVSNKPSSFFPSSVSVQYYEMISGVSVSIPPQT